jgi:pyruvate/2-oxoglutarate dehydrogenase complex dihydrolipoamide acyltransferase (E2) component
MQLIRIPKASENLEAATIGKWLRAEGDEVRAGEQIVEVLTDKADFAIEAEESGCLRRVAATEKSTVPVGYIIGVIARPEDPLPDIDSENEKLMRDFVAPNSSKPSPRPAPGPSLTGKKIPATPAARRLAKEHGIDLADVAAARRKKNVISARDVEEYIQQNA